MGLEQIFATQVIKSLFKIIEGHELSWNQSEDTIESCLGRHMTQLNNWSSRIQSLEMSAAEGTDDSTVELTLDTVPRKFRGPRVTEKVGESHILNDDCNYLLLGDPGSGKTTTVKRLVRRLLTTESASDGDRWQYPLVVRLRDLSGEIPLTVVIADILGLKYEKEDEGRGDVSEHVTVKKLEEIVPGVLSSTNAILFLDGLDESSQDQRIRLERSISKLTLSLPAGKVVLTCRSGDYVRRLENFDVLELCPLEEIQITTIVSKWITDPSEFLGKVRGLPFHDLATRPLLLNHLIVLYRNSGDLPDQPSEVYRRTVRLLLEDWDKQRGVRRRTKYAGFDPERKIDFLSALSYHLTFKSKTKIFRTADLVDAYEAICARFHLPEKEASAVASEIETHTGIIVDAGSYSYEFSHLSLQEYLCAYYLVREPFADHFTDYLAQYTAPLAIAVSLSSNPGNWFAGLVLNKKSERSLQPSNIVSFLSRLKQERPAFNYSRHLGFAIIRLLFIDEDAVMPELEELLDSKEVASSLGDALRWYFVDTRGDNLMNLGDGASRLLIKRKTGLTMEFDFSYPESGWLSDGVFSRLLRIGGLEVVRDPTGTEHVIRPVRAAS